MVASGLKKCDDPNCKMGETAPTSRCDFAERCASACAAYGRVCPCSARAAGRAACKALEKLSDGSEIFQSKPNMTKLNADDLIIHKKKLGEGGFSVVHECVLNAGEEAGQSFAIKYLKRKVMVNQNTFELGAADLAVEAQFLSALDHPNIVKLHGVTAGSVDTNFATGQEHGFFIVVDRLYDTLEHRIEVLGKEQVDNLKSTSLLSRMSAAYKEERRNALNDRLRMAIDIANAMEYLHGLNICYRDLKPDNIGFDENGTLKLFDFGLAKELKHELKKSDDKYKMTGNTGSRRYMAPEVAREMTYGKAVDSYSFGILLWELCALEKPFFGYSAGKHQQEVVMGGQRPRLDTANTSWFPMNLQWLLKKCWSPFAITRPDFTLIKKCLQEIIDGIDIIPQEETDQKTLSVDKEPKVFPVPLRSLRQISQTSSKSVGNPQCGTQELSPSMPPKGGFKSIPRAGLGGRSRTWGFGMRR